MKATVETYSKAGFGDPKWDDAARRCLVEFAKSRSGALSADEPSGEVISYNASAAVNAGCKDPLVNYLYVRFAMRSDSEEAFAKGFYDAAKAMDGSSYPALWKFYSDARALQQLFGMQNRKPDGKVNELLQMMLTSAVDTLNDKSVPADDAGEVAYLAFFLTSGDARNEEAFYKAIEPLISKNWPNSYGTYYARGNFFVDQAWAARGGGTADSVTSEGWLGFSNNLVSARSEYEHAWKLDSKQPKIAEQMMTVVLGLGSGRDQMELWFNRAMDLDTNNFEACKRKLQFLTPKWYGSDEELLAFGRECYQSTKWGGRVPLIILYVHDAAESRLEGVAKAAYWKRPEVWADIQSAFDRFFELNPDGTGWYHDYARYAYRAEQWDKLNELIPKLGDINYKFFGGKEEYEKMVQVAKAHASH